MNLTLIVVLVALALVAMMIVSAYNRFVSLKNQGEEAFAQIDAHLKQRYDLIPNLVETVKGYATHEQKTLTAVIAARNAAISAEGFDAKEAANKKFESALKSIFALSEAYPELKANTNFMSLQNELSQLEKEILEARKYYNAVVKTFNTTIQTFPNSVIAGIFGSRFQKLPYLETSAEERQNVKVKF